MRFFTILVFSIFISSTIFSQKDRHSTSMQDAWLSCTATANPNTVRGTGHWIMYDFKDVYSLHEATFWNFNTPTRLNHYRNMSWSLNLLQGSLEDGLKDIFIDFSLDGIQWQEWGRFTIPKAKVQGFMRGFQVRILMVKSPDMYSSLPEITTVVHVMDSVNLRLKQPLLRSVKQQMVKSRQYCLA
ncbi:MAG: hypothetical protein IPG79_03685 [Saprospiraceae bacterium]|nr:hypothetical protein [Saprospiraceae bacterium]